MLMSPVLDGPTVTAAAGGFAAASFAFKSLCFSLWRTRRIPSVASAAAQIQVHLRRLLWFAEPLSVLSLSIRNRFHSELHQGLSRTGTRCMSWRIWGASSIPFLEDRELGRF